MKRLISKCPECQGNLQISTMCCPDCGMELKSNFELSIFDELDKERYQFLIIFLESRGSLKEVQSRLKISYPTAKRKLDELLIALKLSTAEEKNIPEVTDMKNLTVDYTSKKASEIIKMKLKEHCGHVTVYTARGLPCEIYAAADGVSFTCDKLPIEPPYTYDYFDTIVDLLRKQGGHARKGNGRNYKFGDAQCDKTTVVGVIAEQKGAKLGGSVYDPVFVMAAVLEWAGIAENGRGELILTEEYRSKL